MRKHALVALDCEGPITLNDNAFELAKAFLPKGERFFANVSKYDDFLADVIKRDGYKAGDTLKIILPFFKAFGITNSRMEDFSEETISFVPHARSMVEELPGLAPSFIISTSYRPYLQALSHITGFPHENIYCTDLDIDAYEISPSETERIKAISEEIASMPMLSWPDDARDHNALSAPQRKVFERLEEIFWIEIPSMRVGRLLKDVNPVGGHEKALSLEDASKKTGIGRESAIYCGDSITDVEAFKMVRDSGGISLAFNGNAYAIKAAEFALISPTATPLNAIIKAFIDLGAKDLRDKLLSQGKKLTAPSLSDLFTHLLGQGKTPDFVPDEDWEKVVLYKVDAETGPEAIMKSEEMRKLIRGADIGGLG